MKILLKSRSGKAFGVPVDMSPEVKRADLVMLATEARDIMGVADPCTEPFWRLPYAPIERRLEVWTPEQAEELFVRRYYELAGGRTVAA